MLFVFRTYLMSKKVWGLIIKKQNFLLKNRKYFPKENERQSLKIRLLSNLAKEFFSIFIFNVVAVEWGRTMRK